MTTEIRDDELHIRHFPTQLSFKHYPISSIGSYEISKGGLLDGFFSWRIRRYPNKISYQCGSHEKVLIKLTNGKNLLLDSRRPDELIAALRSEKEII